MKKIILIVSLLLTSCAFIPRDLAQECTSMGFVPMTEQHSNCQLQLRMQISNNAAIRSHGYLTRDQGR